MSTRTTWITGCVAGLMVAAAAVGGCNQESGGEGAGVGVAAGTQLSVVYTANTIGEIEPCG